MSLFAARVHHGCGRIAFCNEMRLLPFFTAGRIMISIQKISAVPSIIIGSGIMN